MKIGEFAKKHDVTIDTVRHYINEGLLTPLRDNTQYSFSEIDDRAMESILLLKRMNFKLDEMKAYLLFQTIFTNNMFARTECFKDRFVEKIQENNRTIEKLITMNKQIEKQLEMYEGGSRKRGVPIGMLSELICPDCDKELLLDASKIVQNEVHEGILICPECGRKYYIHQGIVGAQEMEDFDSEDITKWVSDLLNQYLDNNDEEYVRKIRELYQKMAEVAGKHTMKATNIMIDGSSIEFLNTAILKAISKDCNLYIHTNGIMIMKEFLEDAFPCNTLLYSGELCYAPFKKSMDYMFVQDYDGYKVMNREFELYPYLTHDADVDMFKIYLDDAGGSLDTEAIFLRKMNELGLVKTSEYSTGKVIRKKESNDLAFVNGIDMEMENTIYSFKTLG